MPELGFLLASGDDGATRMVVSLLNSRSYSLCSMPASALSNSSCRLDSHLPSLGVAPLMSK